MRFSEIQEKSVLKLRFRYSLQMILISYSKEKEKQNRILFRIEKLVKNRDFAEILEHFFIRNEVIINWIFSFLLLNKYENSCELLVFFR